PIARSRAGVVEGAVRPRDRAPGWEASHMWVLHRTLAWEMVGDCGRVGSVREDQSQPRRHVFNDAAQTPLGARCRSASSSTASTTRDGSSFPLLSATSWTAAWS